VVVCWDKWPPWGQINLGNKWMGDKSRVLQESGVIWIHWLLYVLVFGWLIIICDGDLCCIEQWNCTGNVCVKVDLFVFNCVVWLGYYWLLTQIIIGVDVVWSVKKIRDHYQVLRIIGCWFKKETTNSYTKKLKLTNQNKHIQFEWKHMF
jgi:hypothetical protein